MPNFATLKAPSAGTAVTRKAGRLIVPDDPIIPYIEGDGTGPDIWQASVRVFDAAVGKAFGGAGASPGSRFRPAKKRKSRSASGFRTTRWKP